MNATSFVVSDISMSFANSNMQISVTANLDQSVMANPSFDDSIVGSAPYSVDTYITFNGRSAQCNYPSSLWIDSAASAGNCVDNYVLPVSWSQAVANCGFQPSESASNVYEQTMTVLRNYRMTDGSDPIIRSESVTRLLQINFPTSVTVTNDVVVLGVLHNVETIQSVSYEPTSSTWTVAIAIQNQAPYKLVSFSSVDVQGGVQSRYIGGSAFLADSDCTENSANCNQNQMIQFSACDALSGQVSFTYTVSCENSSDPDCVPPTGTFQIVTNLNTGTSCPVINTISFDQESLQSFSDSSVTNPQASFNNNQFAYFGALVHSSEANIVSLTVSGVCLQYHGAGTCFPVEFQTFPSVNGYDPVFGIDMSQTTSLNPGTGQTWSVLATIDVQFENVQVTRSATAPQQIGIHSAITVNGNSESSLAKPSQSKTNVTYVAVIASLGAAVVVAVIVVVVVLLKKKVIVAAAV